MNLDFAPDQFRKHIDEASELILRTHSSLENRKVFHGYSSEEVAKIISESLPIDEKPMSDVLKEVEGKVIPYATFNSGPFCNPYVLSCGNQAGTIASFIEAFLNQNCGKWHLSAIGTEMEQLVIRWLSEFMGVPDHDKGILVSGGSMANLTCLSVARNTRLTSVRTQGLIDQKPLITFVSSEVHHCVISAIELLGLGKDNIRIIPVNPDFTMDLRALEDAITETITTGSIPFCVVASAGTVNTGAIDPLKEIGLLCCKYKLWFHVDAAYGGPAANLLSVHHLFKGLEIADSIAVDPHKWLYVPMEAGCALFKNMNLSKLSFSYDADYLDIDKDDKRLDFTDHGIQLSRSFKALKIWMTIKVFGSQKLKEAIQADIDKTKILENLINKLNDFEIIEKGPLSIICFRFNPQANLPDIDLDNINTILIREIEQDGRIFITGTKVRGLVVLRACFVNHRTKEPHIKFMVKVIGELAHRVLDIWKNKKQEQQTSYYDLSKEDL